MAQNTKIEWCNDTVNLWHGCTKVHAGCDNCYAEKQALRWGNDVWGNDKPRKEIKSAFSVLDRLQKLAFQENQLRKVFVGSMMDIFEKPMPLIGHEEYSTGALRNSFFGRIDENFYPNLVFLLLTKRPSNINKYIPDHWKATPPNNVMFGTSPVNQETFDKLIPQLLQVKGKRFLSIEPQLGPIWMGNDLTGIDWIIQGGESGNGKRPFDLLWADDMKVQCAHLEIPYFFKQIDKIQAIPQDLLIREFPTF